MNRRLDGVNPLAYMGVKPSSPTQMVVNKDRRPTSTDLQNFQLGTWWIIPTRGSAPTQEVWILINKTATTATWIELDSGGGAVVPGANHTILIADGSGGYGTNVGPGTAGQVLLSGGSSANPAYVTPTAGTGLVVTTNASTLEYALDGSSYGSVVVQKFTSSDTYTPTAGMLHCVVECVGGGAAGGFVAATTDYSFTAGGGGAGGYARKVFDAATVGASQSITIGAGGSGDTSTTPSASGGATTFGALLTANGGTGAVKGSPGNYVVGGIGGTAASGDINITGGQGNYGYGGIATGMTAAITGKGGDSFYGAGGIYQLQDTELGGSTVGATGSGYGSGGSGAGGGSISGGTATAAAAGGDGADGICIITEYVG